MMATEIRRAIDEAVRQAQIEIIADMIRGAQPIDILSFQELYEREENIEDYVNESLLPNVSPSVRLVAACEVQHKLNMWLAFWSINQRISDGPPS
jgi:hypothetical protein